MASELNGKMGELAADRERPADGVFEGQSLAVQLCQARRVAKQLERELDQTQHARQQERGEHRTRLAEARAERDELAELLEAVEAFLDDRGIWDGFLAWYAARQERREPVPPTDDQVLKEDPF